MLRTGSFDRSGRRTVHEPLHDIYPVSHQVRENATTEIPEKSPLPVFDGRERLVRGGSEEAFPVEPARINLLFGLMRRRPDVILIPVHLRQRDLAQAPTLDELLREQIMIPASLLGARRYHASGFFHARD